MARQSDRKYKSEDNVSESISRLNTRLGSSLWPEGGGSEIEEFDAFEEIEEIVANGIWRLGSSLWPEGRGSEIEEFDEVEEIVESASLPVPEGTDSRNRRN